MASIGISDVVIASVYSEKTRLKKLMMVKNKSQEMTVFTGAGDRLLRYETKARKVITLYRYVSIESLLKSVIKKR